MKALIIMSAILLASGYTYAGPNDNVKNSVRDRIAATIEQSAIEGQGQVTLKFGVTADNKLQILKIESSDKNLSMEVTKALEGTKFPKGAKGVYSIKLTVNENKSNNYDMFRDQIYGAVEDIDAASGESVKLKLRALNAYGVQVLKAESTNMKLAEKVKENIESGKFYIPKTFNGEYALTVTYK